MTPTGLALLLGPLSLLIIFALFVRFKHVWQRKVAGFRWDRHIAPPPIGKTVPGVALLYSLSYRIVCKLFALWSTTGAAGRHVAVVGGGIAGTSAAFALANAGAKVTLYECDNIVGGRCATVRRMVGKW